MKLKLTISLIVLAFIILSCSSNSRAYEEAIDSSSVLGVIEEDSILIEAQRVIDSATATLNEEKPEQEYQKPNDRYISSIDKYIEDVKTEFEIMEIECFDVKVENDRLIAFVNDSKIENGDGIAQSICYTAKKHGIYGVVIKNMRAESIGRAVCR